MTVTDAREEVSVPDYSREYWPHGRVRVRTLELIRWTAVLGQTVSLITIYYGFHFSFPLVPAVLVVAALVAVNLWSTFHNPTRARLSDRDAAFYIGFDVLQFSALLYLTGGLQNPFAVLILAPVTISATILSRSSTFALGVFAVLSVSLLATWHMPLPWTDGTFAMPALYVFGVWLALVLSIIMLATYNWNVSEEARRLSDALAATQLNLAREQRRSALGMLAAAAAHELGSPLGTIAVVAKEIARELPKDSEYAEDVALLLSQSERCRQILASLGQHEEETDAVPWRRLPVTALVESIVASDTWDSTKVSVASSPAAEAGDTQVPNVRRSPEIINGLNNLIQNAAQFAREQVIVEVGWDSQEVMVTISDDGPGFASNIMHVLGEPYVSGRKRTSGHMGLGVFIAQTLLERTGGVLSFANRREGGARVTVRWRRELLEGEDEEQGSVTS